MDGRSVLVGMLIGVIIGGFLAYAGLSSQLAEKDARISELSSQVDQLQTSYAELEQELNILKSQYSELEAEHSSLKEEYSRVYTDYLDLKNKYSRLEEDYSKLQAKYSDVKSRYRSLCDELINLNEFMDSYYRLLDSFSRTLNEDEIEKTGQAVLSAGVSASDFWYSIQRIYQYITSNIQYAKDVDIPYVTLEYIDVGGEPCIFGIDVYTVRNYVQTPALTLELGQGDCEDQAILAYAMIKYYMRNVYGTEYNLYLALISFSKGSSHAAVILPVKGGEICIIDPAANYLTSSWWTITSKPAASELQTYSSRWTHSTGSITHISLYQIDVNDGSYRLIYEGSLSEVAAFLSE